MTPRLVRTLLRGAVASLSALALAACSTAGARSTSNGIAFGSITTIPAADRKPAPDLAGTLLGGGRYSLDQAAGRVVVLNVWASWCVPCRSEAPALVAAARSLPGVTFLGIDIRDDQSNAAAFIRRYDVPYRSFFDQDSSLLLDLQQVVPVPAQPVTIVLDTQHRVAASIYGATTAITLRDLARPLERSS